MRNPHRPKTRSGAYALTAAMATGLLFPHLAWSAVAKPVVQPLGQEPVRFRLDFANRLALEGFATDSSEGAPPLHAATPRHLPADDLIPFTPAARPRLVRHDLNLASDSFPSPVVPAMLTTTRHTGGLVVGGRFAGALAGFWAAALTHELGHALATWAYGDRFQWPTTRRESDPFLPLWNVHGDYEAEKLRNIALSGFLFSAGVSEALLAFDTFPKSDVFIGGFLFYDLLNAFLYVVRDMYAYGKDGRGIGDIRMMDEGGIPRQVVYLVLITKSVITLARILEDPDFIKLRYWWDSEKP